MYEYKGILVADLGELIRTDDGPAVMTRKVYSHLRDRGQIHVVRRGGGLETGVLVEYASLPTRFKAAYAAKYGDPGFQMLALQSHLI